MDIEVLGPVRLNAGGRPERLGPQLARLVAALVCARGEAVGSERLVTLLWDDAPRAGARDRQATLRSHVSHLRRLLASDGDPDAPEVRRVSGRGYALTVPPRRLDADRFEGLVLAGRAAASRDDAVLAVARYREALLLWRGTPFGALARQPYALAEGRRLAELRAAAGQGLLLARLEAGDHAAIVRELGELVAARPRQVEPRRMLVTALHRAGRPDEAIAACRAGLALLAADGVASPVLEALLHELLAGPARPGWMRAGELTRGG